MEKEEFIEACVSCGYASRKIATHYVSKKDTVSEEDFIDIFREIERAKDIASDNRKFRKVEGIRTTKRYKQSARLGNDRI